MTLNLKERLVVNFSIPILTLVGILCISEVNKDVEKITVDKKEYHVDESKIGDNTILTFISPYDSKLDVPIPGKYTQCYMVTYNDLNGIISWDYKMFNPDSPKVITENTPIREDTAKILTQEYFKQKDLLRN